VNVVQHSETHLRRMLGLVESGRLAGCTECSLEMDISDICNGSVKSEDASAGVVDESTSFLGCVSSYTLKWQRD
jgi:hypothetical protein